MKSLKVTNDKIHLAKENSKPFIKKNSNPGWDQIPCDHQAPKKNLFRLLTLVSRSSISVICEIVEERTGDSHHRGDNCGDSTGYQKKATVAMATPLTKNINKPEVEIRPDRLPGSTIVSAPAALVVRDACCERNCEKILSSKSILTFRFRTE